MAEHQERLSSETSQGMESPATSDREPENFEDAVDTGSIRSLTKRTSAHTKTSRVVSGGVDAADSGILASQVDPVEQTNGHDEKGQDELTNGTHDKPDRNSKDLSNDLMDSVVLDDESTEQTREEQPVNEKESPNKLSLSNITNSLPPMPWSPSSGESPSKNSSTAPPTSTPISTAATAIPPVATSRKLTSPFSWLSRNTTQKDTVSSPPQAATSPRRNTTSSVATLTSNPEMMLSKLAEDKESDGLSSPRGGNSLKDRFKVVRMREETVVSVPSPGEDEKVTGTPASRVNRSTSLGLMSPTGEGGQDNGAAVPSSPIPPSPNHALAPGTASGVSAGPSAMADTPVDWDLWQAVVYEGPSAVARTSPEELNKAIATGIPNVIRGVVWQVLAQSKNDGLEMVYKELAVRGTDKDKDRNSNGTVASSSSNGNLSIDREALASSASSVHSEQSGTGGPKSPSVQNEKDPEATTKAQALAAAERKKKQTEDAAKLSKLEKAIRRDLGARTSFSKHAAAAGLQDGLFGVCKAYALFDEAVGYAQGMNFLAMPLLFNMPEEEAFCLLVRLMNQYKLRDLFIQDMPGLHMHLYQFERLLEDLEPAVYCHLHRRGVSPHLYATQWFLTLFAYRFPLQLVLRIYDLIFSEGLSAILRFGIVLMQKNASALLSMSDMSQLSSFLKDKIFDVYIDQAPSAGSILENGFFGSSSSSIDKEVYRADQLVRDACEVKVTPELLRTYTAEWEEKTHGERERELELDGLRSANASYAVKQRKLEERIEACDREQAAMATELVHTKVENEELKDQNESLRGQVRELRVVIERQPQEIEQAWQLERDNLMQRNQKVHEENQKVEKEMSELEEELVQTKMRYAEINSQHETLQRKWGDLKRQFA